MSFNYGKEKRKFDKQWAEKAAWYESCGMDAAAIAEMHEYDWKWFCQERIYANRAQPLPKEIIDEDDERSLLFLKFESLSTVFPDDEISGRYGWIEALDDERLTAKMHRLTTEDLELLTLIAVYAYTQDEIATILGVTQQAISKQIMRIKKKFKSF